MNPDQVSDDDEYEVVNNIDPALQVPCDACGHDKLDHAFFPAADGYLGAPAPLCVQPECECEGFESHESDHETLTVVAYREGCPACERARAENLP